MRPSAEATGAPAGAIGPGPLLGAAAAAALILGACAREMPPPGSLPDEAVPRIVSIRPGPDSIVPGFDGTLRLRFDEPVNVPQDLARRMFVSPMEEYRMETGFSDIRLEPVGGWRDSVVYCYEIPEGITDLLRNRMEDTTSFCFSTGIPITSTRAIGTVLEAVTGRPPQEARILFHTETDTTPYGARAGTDGTFSARALPPGAYRAYGFVDQNRNLRLDPTLEPYDSADVVLRPDSVVRLAFSLIPPDTTPPLLLRATAVDPYTVELEFDDPLRNPQAIPPRVDVQDSLGTAVPVLATGIGRSSEANLPAPDTATAAGDSVGLPGDSAAFAGDSLAVADSAASVAGAAPGDTLRGAGEGPAPAGGPGAPAGQDSVAPILPSRFVAVRFDEALLPGTYRVSASGLINLRRLVGGGDTTFVVAPPPEPADSGAVGEAPAPDSSATRPDTAVVRDSTNAADTTVVRDTVALTSGARRRP